MNKLLLLILVLLLAADWANAQRLPNSWFRIGASIAPDFIEVDAAQNAYVLNGGSLRRYSATGISQWERCGGAGLALAPASLYVSGTYEGNSNSCAFGNGVTVPATAAGIRAGYLVRYDLTGVAGWARQLGPARGTMHFGVAADAARGVVYSTGSFTDNHVLYQTTAAGAAGWDVQATGEGQLSGRVVAVDAGTGDIYVAGSLTGTVDLGGYLLSAAGGTDGFVARITAQGTVAWAARIGGASGDDAATHLRTDEAGNAYVAGHFVQEINSLPGNAPALTAVGGSQNIFVVSYSRQGELRWAQRAGGGAINTVKGFDYATPGRLLLSVAPLARTYIYGPTTVLTAPANQQTLLILNLDAPSGSLLAGTQQEILDLAGGSPELFPQCVVVHPPTGGIYLGGVYYGQYRIGGYELGRVFDTNVTTAMGRLGGEAVVVTAARASQGNTPMTVFPVPVRAGQAITVKLAGTETWRLLNSLGQVVRTESVAAGANEAIIPTAGLAPGRYTLQILSATGVATRVVLVD